MALRMVFEPPPPGSQDLAVECRTCSSMGAIHPIFAPIEGGFIVPLSEMLTECTGIEVHEGDLAPAFICGECAQTLFMAYKFKKTAVEKDQSRRNNVVWTNGAFGAEYQVPPAVVRTFNSRLSHIDHHRTHRETQNTNRKNNSPRKCFQCTELFTTKASLKRHQESHTQLLRFSCKMCPTQFKTAKKLSEHLSKLHGKVPLFACPKCNKRFHCKTGFRKHLDSKHNKKKRGKKKSVKKVEVKNETPNVPAAKINIKTEPKDENYNHVPVKMEPPW